MMLYGYQSEEELIQNLIDAGCGESTVDRVVDCLEQGQKQKGLLLLQKQRKTLLDGIHKEQSCIGYLDDVLNEMRRECT